MKDGASNNVVLDEAVQTKVIEQTATALDSGTKKKAEEGAEQVITTISKELNLEEAKELNKNKNIIIGFFAEAWESVNKKGVEVGQAIVKLYKDVAKAFKDLGNKIYWSIANIFQELSGKATEQRDIARDNKGKVLEELKGKENVMEGLKKVKAGEGTYKAPRDKLMSDIRGKSRQ